MEDIIDAIIAEIQALVDGDTFFQTTLPIQMIHFDDPLLVTIDQYPYIYVAPMQDSPKNETMGRAGYDRETHLVTVGICVQANDYFDGSVEEKPASRYVVRAAHKIKRHLRRLQKRGLPTTTGVNNLVVGGTNYVPEQRSDSFLKLAIISLAVDRQYQNED